MVVIDERTRGLSEERKLDRFSDPGEAALPEHRGWELLANCAQGLVGMYEEAFGQLGVDMLVDDRAYRTDGTPDRGSCRIMIRVGETTTAKAQILSRTSEARARLAQFRGEGPGDA